MFVYLFPSSLHEQPDIVKLTLLLIKLFKCISLITFLVYSY